MVAMLCVDPDTTMLFKWLLWQVRVDFSAPCAIMLLELHSLWVDTNAAMIMILCRWLPSALVPVLMGLSSKWYWVNECLTTLHAILLPEPHWLNVDNTVIMMMHGKRLLARVGSYHVLRKWGPAHARLTSVPILLISLSSETLLLGLKLMIPVQSCYWKVCAVKRSSSYYCMDHMLSLIPDTCYCSIILLLIDVFHIRSWFCWLMHYCFHNCSQKTCFVSIEVLIIAAI